MMKSNNKYKANRGLTSQHKEMNSINLLKDVWPLLRFRQSATKFEKTRIQFKSDVFVAVAVVCAKKGISQVMLYFSIDTVLSLDSFSQFHKLILV